jgi:hypothetical protein
MQFKLRPAIIFFLIIFSMSATACNSNGVSAPNPSDPKLIGACDNSLYPIKQGATWTYLSAGGPNGSFNYTDTVAETHVGGFTLTSKFQDFTRSQIWACQTDGLKALQLGGGSVAGISTQGMTAEFETLDATGISLPRDITAGMQWRYDLKMQGTIAMPGNQAKAHGIYTVVMQEMGKETVTVPAGVFEAVKLQANSSIEVAANFEGVDIPVKFNGVAMMWYAPGVGYVKSVENGDFGGAVFSTVTELQSYSIP